MGFCSPLRIWLQKLLICSRVTKFSVHAKRLIEFHANVGLRPSFRCTFIVVCRNVFSNASHAIQIGSIDSSFAGSNFSTAITAMRALRTLKTSNYHTRESVSDSVSWAPDNWKLSLEVKQKRARETRQSRETFFFIFFICSPFRECSDYFQLLRQFFFFIDSVVSLRWSIAEVIIFCSLARSFVLCGNNSLEANRVANFSVVSGILDRCRDRLIGCRGKSVSSSVQSDSEAVALSKQSADISRWIKWKTIDHKKQKLIGC